MFSSQTETKGTTPSSSPSSTDAEKIKRLITLIKGAAANAKTADGKDIVLVIGPTGAGKSTLINCFLSKELGAVESDTGDYEFAAKETKDGIAGPKIGHGGSCTTYPEVFQSKEGLAFCDTAGFFDTRSKEHSQSAYYALHVAVSVARSLKGILFVCDIETMKASRGAFFINAVKLLTTILHTNEEYGRSVFFLITKASGVTHKNVIANIKKLKIQTKEDGNPLATRLLEILEDKPDSVMTVSAEELMGKAGLDFASKIYGRLRGAQIKAEHFSVGGGEAGKEEYLQAYQHIMNQALNQIQVLTWKTEDLAAAEDEIKTIEKNISSNQTLITATEEKLLAAKNSLTDKNAENERELKALNDRLRTIPDEVKRLEGIEIKEIDEAETRRHLGFIEEIKRQHEANRHIAEQGVEENIRNREAQIVDWEEKNRQALRDIEAKNQSINILGEEIRRLTGENEDTNGALDDELRLSQADADELVRSLQRDGDYQRFPEIREIKLQIDTQRNSIAALDREIENIESEKQRHQNRITELRNDDRDYLVHTSSDWSEQSVYGTVAKGVVHHFPYNYTSSSEVKRDDYRAVISASEGAPGSVSDRFLRGRECGGTYHTPSHVYGSFIHQVYISRKYSPENTAEAARLQTLCDGLAARQTEKRNRKEQLQHEVERLQGELTNRRNDEERRIREQADARRVAIENRRAEARRQFEAARDERNQRIQALRNEIIALEGDIANREANIADNRAAILDLRQNGRIDVERINQQKDDRVHAEEKRKEDTITQRQTMARERRNREKNEKIETTQREIAIQTANGRQIQEVGGKLIRDLEIELARKQKAALDYEAAQKQGKERRTNLLKDLNSAYQEFMGMKSNYDAIIDLFGLLKLRENYAEFISKYETFLKTLFVRVGQLVGSTAIPPDSKKGSKPATTPFESKTPDTEQQRANDVFISQLIGNASLLQALFYEGARGVRDLEEPNTFFDRKEPASRATCFMNTLQRQVILLHQLQKQGLDYKFVQDDKHLNHILDCGTKGRILLPELRIEHKGDQLSDATKEQFRFLLATHLSKGREDRPLFIPVHLPGHFTLLSLEKKDNKVHYRYIDSLHHFTHDREDADRAIKTKLAEVIQLVVGSPPLEIRTPYLKQQTNGTGEHYNECALHTVFATLYQLKQGISTDMGTMRAHLQIPGRNVTGNGGLDSEDALSIIPNYRSLCESLDEQVKAAAKARKQGVPSAASSSSTMYGRRSPSPEPGAPQSSRTFRAAS